MDDHGSRDVAVFEEAVPPNDIFSEFDEQGTFFGALRSPDDPLDWIYEHVAEGAQGMYLAEFPDEFDLRQYAAPSREQGARPTCAAFTSATITEMNNSQRRPPSVPMSPEFIYFHRKNKPGKGMYGRDMLYVMQKIGSVPEDVFPYSDRDRDLSPPSAEIYALADKNKIYDFVRITTIDGLKRALLELGPCSILLPLYANRAMFWQAHDDEKFRCGHAVTVVGYNKTGFILKNSWGSTWNGDGCTVFPYGDWGRHWECWAPVHGQESLFGAKLERTPTTLSRKGSPILRRSGSIDTRRGTEPSLPSIPSANASVTSKKLSAIDPILQPHVVVVQPTVVVPIAQPPKDAISSKPTRRKSILAKINKKGCAVS